MSISGVHVDDADDDDDDGGGGGGGGGDKDDDDEDDKGSDDTRNESVDGTLGFKLKHILFDAHSRPYYFGVAALHSALFCTTL